MVIRKYFLALLIILFAGFVSSSFSVGNSSHSIDKTYAPEGNIRGWVNISFIDESADSLFKGSNGGTIKLLDLLKKNKNYAYSCKPNNCAGDYSAEGGATSLALNLENGKSKIVGFKLTGIIDKINYVNFKVDSDATSSCEDQLKIDFFDSGIYAGNNKSAAEICALAQNYGCFDNTLTTELLSVGTTPYCQRINLTESPGFSLGAWVSEVSNTNKKLTMELYDSYGDEKAKCDLSGFSAGSEVSCNVNYAVTEAKEYYICIVGDSGTGTYKIKGASVSKGCGFNDLPVKTLMPAAYQIFAKGKKFANFGTLSIVNSLYGENIAEQMQDYIYRKYGTLDCTGGCVVPLEITPGQNQQATFKDAQINYKNNIGLVDETKFYELNQSSAKINSGFQKLYLDEGGFSAPAQYGNSTFILSLDDKSVFSETISVSNIIPAINGVSPTIVAAAFPTKFQVNVNSSVNITRYEWVFGNDTKTTSTNYITYTLNSIGTQQLKITVTDSKQQSSFKTFDIEVVSPKEKINTTLGNDFEYLDSIKLEINRLSGFYKDSLNSLLNIPSVEEILEQARDDYNNASSDAEYVEIMKNLAELRIPKSISATKVANSLSFYTDKNAVNLDVLKAIGGGDYTGDSSKYIDAILAWNQKNLETKINFKEFSANYEEGQETLLNFFEINIEEKTALDYDYYFVLGLKDANFDIDSVAKQQGNYFYIVPGNKILFSTPEEVDFTNLPAFISPGISRLTISEGNITPTEEKSKWGLFIAIIIGLLILGIIVYITLQQWYKYKYEKHLFTDRNNLFNLITYIDSAKKKGFNDEDIGSKLKKAGWDSEQRDYALKKYAGKNTGMLELPITKIFELLKQSKDKEFPQGKIPPSEI